MKGRQLRTLSLAVNYNRIGFVFLIGRQPMFWKLSFKAGSTARNAEKHLKRWLDEYDPEIVITERLETMGRKTERSKMLLDVVYRTICKHDVQHITQDRTQPYRNLYDQIDRLCERYPQMEAARPKRRKFYQKEPPYVTVFDALSLADAINS